MVVIFFLKLFNPTFQSRHLVKISIKKSHGRLIRNRGINGVISYMASEIFRYSIYSFGIIVWELITGRMSF